MPIYSTNASLRIGLVIKGKYYFIDTQPDAGREGGPNEG